MHGMEIAAIFHNKSKDVDYGSLLLLQHGSCLWLMHLAQKSRINAKYWHCSCPDFKNVTVLHVLKLAFSGRQKDAAQL